MARLLPPSPVRPADCDSEFSAPILGAVPAPLPREPEAPEPFDSDFQVPACASLGSITPEAMDAAHVQADEDPAASIESEVAKATTLLIAASGGTGGALVRRVRQFWLNGPTGWRGSQELWEASVHTPDGRRGLGSHEDLGEATRRAVEAWGKATAKA